MDLKPVVTRVAKGVAVFTISTVVTDAIKERVPNAEDKFKKAVYVVGGFIIGAIIIDALVEKANEQIDTWNTEEVPEIPFEV